MVNLTLNIATISIDDEITGEHIDFAKTKFVDIVKGLMKYNNFEYDELIEALQEYFPSVISYNDEYNEYNDIADIDGSCDFDSIYCGDNTIYYNIREVINYQPDLENAYFPDDDEIDDDEPDTEPEINNLNEKSRNQSLCFAI